MRPRLPLVLYDVFPGAVKRLFVEQGRLFTFYLFGVEMLPEMRNERKVTAPLYADFHYAALEEIA